VWAVSVVAAWWCLFLWTGGAAAAALPRAGFIPWTRPSCSLCQVCVCGDQSVRSRRRAYRVRRVAVLSTHARTPVRGCIAGSGKRAVSHTSRTVRVRCGAGLSPVACRLSRVADSPSVGRPRNRTFNDNVPRLPRTAGSKAGTIKAIINIITRPGSERPSRRGDRAAPLPISNATTAVRSADQFHEIRGSPPGPVAPRRLRSET